MRSVAIPSLATACRQGRGNTRVPRFSEQVHWFASEHRGLSLAAGLPYVFAKYTAPRPPPPPIPILPWDQCHCWQSGWQDWGFTARYNVVTADHGAFVLTPSVSVGLPSHAYEFRGEAVLGRHLKEVRIAMDAGLRLDRISRNLSVQGRYSYAFVERVIGIPNNRSNANVEGAYLLLKGKLAARGFALWQRTPRRTAFRITTACDSCFPWRSGHPGTFV